MVPTYSEYIASYLPARKGCARPIPGEHHFVCAYLVPKLFKLNGIVPDYINPDGTKSILGDVVYYRNDRHHCGIEIKLESIDLTKKEFNNWIARHDPEDSPNLFLGICRSGIAISTWSAFRTAYISAVKSKNQGWEPISITERYGPSKRLDQIFEHMPHNSVFPFARVKEEGLCWEEKFTRVLSTHIGA